MRLVRVVGAIGLGTAAVALLAVSFGLVTGRWRVVPVLSGSMEPAIGAGALAVTSRVDADRVGRGDVIVFHAPTPDAPVVMHRVTEVVERGPRPVIRTKGDANGRADPWLARIEDDDVWAVRRVVPGAGHVAVLAATPTLRVAALSLAVTILAGLGIMRIWRPGEPAVRRPRAT